MRDRGCGRQALNCSIFKAFNHRNACLWLVLTRGHCRTDVTGGHHSDWYWLGVTTEQMWLEDTVDTGIDWGSLPNICNQGTLYWLVLTGDHYRTDATGGHCNDWYWLGGSTERMQLGDSVKEMVEETSPQKCSVKPSIGPTMPDHVFQLIALPFNIQTL